MATEQQLGSILGELHQLRAAVTAQQQKLRTLKSAASSSNSAGKLDAAVFAEAFRAAGLSAPERPGGPEREDMTKYPALVTPPPRHLAELVVYILSSCGPGRRHPGKTWLATLRVCEHERKVGFQKRRRASEAERFDEVQRCIA